MFETKIAIIVRDDLATWQKLNVTAFLASGIAAARSGCIGSPYIDAEGREYAPMLGQPVLIFAGDAAGIERARTVARDQGLQMAGYIEAMFATGHDAANRAAFQAADPGSRLWAGLALHGARKAVDKAVKGLKLHG